MNSTAPIPDGGPGPRRSPRIHSWRRALLFGVMTAGGLSAASPESAMERLSRGDTAGARQEYETLLQARPGDSRLAFNAAVMAYGQEDWDGAARHFESALGSSDLSLQRRSFLGLGNTRFRQGESTEELADRVRLWEEAARQFEAAVGLDPSDTEARANLETVQQQLARLPKPPEDQKKDQQKQDPKDQKSDEEKEEEKKEQEGEQDPKDQKGQDQKDPSGKDPDKKDSQQQKDGDKSDPKDSEGQKSEGSKPGDKKSEQGKDGKGDGKKEPGEKGEKGDDTEGEEGEEGKDGKPGKGGRTMPGGAEGGEDSAEGQMAVRFAERLLDSHKREEKALIWRPAQQQDRSKDQNNRRKTW